MHQLRIIVFGQMLGLPGSCVLVPYVPLYRLRQHHENYCDCALVHPDEHLSRESRKLTVMIGRETGRCSRGFFESLKTYAASSEELDLSGLGVDSAPNSVF